MVTLASGTAIAQLLLALAMPALTRLYTPADYGTLAVYSSTLTVLLVLASLRYEAAIPLPEDEEVAGSLLALTLIVLAAMAVLVALLVWLAGDAFVARANGAGAPTLPVADSRRPARRGELSGPLVLGDSPRAPSGASRGRSSARASDRWWPRWGSASRRLVRRACSSGT